MKKLFLALVVNMIYSQFANALTIEQITVSAANSQDINVYVKTVNGYTFDYYSYSYTVENNIITLTVCYSQGLGAAISASENNFLITNINSIQDDYQLIVNVLNIYFSGTEIICGDGNPPPDTATLFFSTPLIEPVSLAISDRTFYIEKIVFSNPSNGLFQFDAQEELLYQLTLYDNTGRIVKSFNLFSKQVFDLRESQNGIYYMNFKTDERQVTKTLVLDTNRL